MNYITYFLKIKHKLYMASGPVPLPPEKKLGARLMALDIE